jgi:3-oxoacyl-[acyl-carrier protein] reductase
LDLNITGKVALITGGSRGLGKQCALSLAREGANVAICGRTADTLADTKAELEGLGANVATIIGDVGERGDIARIHSEAVAALGPIDILVNNVGGTKSREDITGTSLEDFAGTFDINLFGGYELMRLVIPHMKEQGWGRITNIASIWGREYGGNISYMSAKAGLIGATKHAAVSLGKYGILVNSIAPGSIAHPGGSWERFQNNNTPEFVQDFIDDNLPLGKFGWPEPVGDLVAFLSSDRSGMITGTCIPVDGGQGISML